MTTRLGVKSENYTTTTMDDASSPQVWTCDNKKPGLKGLSQKKCKYDISAYFKIAKPRVVEISRNDQEAVIKVKTDDHLVMSFQTTDVQVQIGDVLITAAGKVVYAQVDDCCVGPKEKDEDTRVKETEQCAAVGHNKQIIVKMACTLDLTYYFGQPKVIIVSHEIFGTRISVYERQGQYQK